MGFWDAIVLIVAIVVIGKVMSGGRWNRERGRWETVMPGSPHEPAALSDTPKLKAEIDRLNARVATLEKLATDPSHRLASEIEQLRKTPPAA